MFSKTPEAKIISTRYASGLVQANYDLSKSPVLNLKLLDAQKPKMQGFTHFTITFDCINFQNCVGLLQCFHSNML